MSPLGLTVWSGHDELIFSEYYLPVVLMRTEISGPNYFRVFREPDESIRILGINSRPQFVNRTRESPCSILQISMSGNFSGFNYLNLRISCITAASSNSTSMASVIFGTNVRTDNVAPV